MFGYEKTRLDNIKKILENQKILSDTMKELRIVSARELASVHYVMRRGMVQMVGDVYELLVPLDAEIEKQLPLNKPLIKQFRDTASHNYGVISDEIAYACMSHCIDKQFTGAIRKLLETAELEKDQEQTTPAGQDKPEAANEPNL